jgi:hypothetical protein
MDGLDRVKIYLDYLAASGFYGSFSTQWENGHLVHTRQETSRKPADLTLPSDTPREQYERSHKSSR